MTYSICHKFAVNCWNHFNDLVPISFSVRWQIVHMPKYKAWRLRFGISSSSAQTTYTPLAFAFIYNCFVIHKESTSQFFFSFVKIWLTSLYFLFVWDVTKFIFHMISIRLINEFLQKLSQTSVQRVQRLSDNVSDRLRFNHLTRYLRTNERNNCLRGGCSNGKVNGQCATLKNLQIMTLSFNRNSIFLKNDIQKLLTCCYAVEKKDWQWRKSAYRNILD